MAYNAVSQADHDATYHASDSEASRSPSPRRRSFQQLPLDADHGGGGSYLPPAKSAEDSHIQSLGSMIRSMTSTSYDMVEDDDYEAVDPPASRRSNSLRRVPPLNTTVGTTATATSPVAHAGSPEPPLRTPVTDTPVPLSHPTPGLESLQGAYLNNVERLERSAERLSSSSADIGSEIRRMNREQKKRSSSSASNATAADGFPVRANMSSQGSIHSASRLAQVSEHGPEERYYQPNNNRDPVEPFLPPPPPHQPFSHVDLDFNYHHDQYDHPPAEEIDRPATAASTDTYQQARVLFGDFDGVHYVPGERGHQDLARQMSLTRPPLAKNSESHKEPQNGEDMVYYPAPVPMMLNLPPRLSQRPNVDREKRRTQLLGSVPSENRKSAPWLAPADPQDGDGTKSEKQLKDLPPQLRASVFFEPPAASLDIDVKKDSAVATLDSILDASAHAPVTAFTDHPYAGHLGREVYGSSKPKTLRKKNPSRSTLLAPQHSDTDTRANSLASRPPYLQTEAEAANIHEGTSLREGSRDGEDGEHLKGDVEDSDEPEVPFTGPPTTLLAELEQRKHQLRQRQRTAATDAMHSTLLQMDAVAQKQSEHRRQRPITLAWESNDTHNAEDEEDDDVPLGMLFPEKTNPADEQRPLGLMEKREMEEGEPLSHRRARLRGEAPPPPPRTPDRRPTTMYSQQVPAPADAAEPDSGDEGETLAQRIARLKSTNRNSTAAESEFTTEILAELSHLQADDDKPKEVAPEDETLAQRRARLHKEAEAKNSTLKIPRYRRSMADILHARRPAPVARPSFNEAAAPQGPAPQRRLDPRMSMQQLPTNFGMSGHASYHPGAARTDSFGPGLMHPNTFYSDAVLGMGHMSYAMPHNYHPKAAPAAIDSGQRAVIDRWRQSIV